MQHWVSYLTWWAKEKYSSDMLHSWENEEGIV